MMRWFGVCSFAAFGALACGESRLLDDFTEQGTRVRISPEVFRGSVPCRSGTAGSLEMYAVRFLQVRQSPVQTDGGLYNEVSPPVPCDRAVALDAIANFLYSAEIYGFDRILAPGELPLEEARWTAECGRGEPGGPFAPTRAIYGTLTPITGCTTFSGDGGAGRTRLVIDQASALGSLRCGSEPGQVLRLEGVLNGIRASAPCGEPLALDVGNLVGVQTIELTAFEASPGSAPITPAPTTSGDPLDASVPLDAASDAAAPAEAGAPPGTPVDAGLGALDAGADQGTARWRSECVGRAQPGLSTTASCEALQPLP